jgi:chemotaxis protein MotB
MAKPKKERKGIPPAAWMATYSDMVTLLMAFFVLLFSFSTIDAEKWKMIVAAFSQSPDSIYEDYPIVIATPGFEADPFFEFPQEGVIAEADAWAQLAQMIHDDLVGADMENVVSVSFTNAEIILRFRSDVLFDSGLALLRPEAIPVIEAVMEQAVLRQMGEFDRIRIVGHTDNRPIRNAYFADNWELSNARALVVLRYIEDKYVGINNFTPEPSLFGSHQLEATGCGEHRPIVENDSEENMQRNRRIDMMLVKREDPENLEEHDIYELAHYEINIIGEEMTNGGE